jgi:hypothetical protein
MAETENYLIEAIKLFGGLAGLATAAFTIYDRLIRNTPILGLASQADSYLRGLAPQLFIRVKNVSDYDLLITSWSVSREGFIVSPNLTGQSAIDALSGVEWIASVGPRQERLLGLWVVRNYLEDEAALPVTITIGWKRTGALYPFKSSQSILRTDTRELAALKEDALREAECLRQLAR